VKLPVWRLILAVLVLVAMSGVLLTLAPVYLENYQLGQYLRQLASYPNAPDEMFRAAVLKRARQLDLPVEPGNIQISHFEGRLQLHAKYIVQMDFPIYQVDLHFHADANSH
jgi:hypothetical protein